MNDVTSTAEREVLGRVCSAISVLRAVVLAWGVLVALIDARSGVLAHPIPAFVTLGVLVVATAWWAQLARTDLVRLVSVGPWVDVLLASAVFVVDHAAYGGEHPQSLASAWPAAAVIAVGVLRGGRAGAAAGAVAGVVNVIAAAAFSQLDGNVLGSVGSLVLLVVAGWVAGTVAARLRSDAVRIARAEAREELARDLHDGVLQTLAVIQRRSDDDELVAMAAAQSSELRALIAGPPAEGHPTVAGGLLGEAPGWSSRFGVEVSVVVIDDAEVSAAGAAALVAAAGEAVVNAAKHSGAPLVTVSVDRGEGGGAVVHVHDEGCGFDPSATPEGLGLSRSIRGRLAEVGGTVEVRSSPGAGCEVALWAP